MTKIKKISTYLLISITILSCNEDKESIPEPLGQVRLSLTGEKNISGEILDIEILDNNGSVLESISSILAPPSNFIELEEGSYQISVSSQNQEFSNFGDLVFNGISDLFDIGRSDTLDVSIEITFDKPLGQIKIELSGLDIGNETFSLISLDADSNVLVTEENILETPNYIGLESGTYQYAIQSSLRKYSTVVDLVFSGYSDEFIVEKGDTITLGIDISLDDRQGWISVPNVPIEKRFSASSFILENNIYIGLGANLSNERFQDWWVYSIDENTWRQLADFPGGKRFGTRSFTIGDKGYVCLGLNENNTSLLELWEFNPQSESWTQLPDFPGSTRSSPTVFVIDQKAYLGSGGFAGQLTLSDFYFYDQMTNEWSQTTDYIGDAASGLTSFTIGDSGHLIGGVINLVEHTNRHVVYNSINETWEELAAFPGTARLEGVGFTIGGKGFFGLGSPDILTAASDLWMYDPTDGIWQETDSFTGDPRFVAVHGSNDSVGYFGFGRKSETDFSDLYLFYPGN